MLEPSKALHILHQQASIKDLMTFETGFLIEFAIHFYSQDYDKAAEAVLYMRDNYKLLFQLSSKQTDAQIDEMMESLTDAQEEISDEELANLPSITTAIKTLTAFKATEKTEEDVLNFWRNIHPIYAEYTFTGLSSQYLMMVYMAGMSFGKELQKHQTK